MSHLSKTKQVANVERRTWDVEAYEQKALARQQSSQDAQPSEALDARTRDAAAKEEFQAAPAGAVGPEGSQRAFLQARKRKITDIDERVGTSVILSVDEATGSKKDSIKLSDGVKSTGVGFHCTVCDCFLKDSMTYLDHINGRKHQRKLGYSMRVERSTESDVLSKLESLKQQHAKQKNAVQEELNFDVLVKEKDEAEERRKEERQRQRKERRQLQKKMQSEPEVEYEVEEEVEEEEEEEDAQIDPAMAALMGFSGFSGGKK